MTTSVRRRRGREPTGAARRRRHPVEVELEPDGDGTLVRLTHRDLPADTFGDHRAGWEHYLDRLAVLAAGSDPGPDPFRTA